MTDNARLAVIAAAAGVLLLVQASAWFPLEVRWSRPDLLLCLVLFTAATAPRCRGAVLCWTLGYGVEALSGLHSGMWQLFFIGLFFFIRLLKKFFHIQTLPNVCLLLLVCQAVKYGYLLFILCSVYEYRYSGFTVLWIRETLVTMLVCPVVYALLLRLTAAHQEPLFVQRSIYHGRRIR